LTGLGNSSSTIESQIMSQEIFGDGNKRGGKKKESINGVNFKENESAEQVEYCMKILISTHRQQAGILTAAFLMLWSTHKIHIETGISRYKINQFMRSGIDTLSRLLVNVGIEKR